jgi:hypothetical protein
MGLRVLPGAFALRCAWRETGIGKPSICDAVKTASAKLYNVGGCLVSNRCQVVARYYAGDSFAWLSAVSANILRPTASQKMITMNVWQHLGQDSAAWRPLLDWY